MAAQSKESEAGSRKGDFDSLPFLRSPNPLACGCAIMGINGLNLFGTMTESRDMHIKLCPTHAAAPELLEALEAMKKAFEQLLPGIRHIACQDYANINEAPILTMKALAKAKGERP